MRSESNERFGFGSRWSRHAWAALTLGVAAGCGGLDDGSFEATLGEPVEARQSALLGNEISKYTPSLGQADDVNLTIAVLEGNGANANRILKYRHSGPSDGTVPPWVLDVTATQSFYRPFQWWENTIGASSALYADMAGSHKIRDDAQANGPVLPQYPDAAVLTGSVALNLKSEASSCAFGFYQFETKRIMQSCVTPGPHWDAWGIEIPAPGLPATPTPTTGPVAINRSPGTDSLFYGCGAGATQVCEFRMVAGSEPKTYVASFGGGSFIDGTRVTALSTTPSLPSTSRWIFAATGDSGLQRIIAMRDVGPLDSATAPTWQSSLVDFGTNVSFSTPVPYVRGDGRAAIVYFRTQGSGTTKIVEASWNGFEWSAPTTIYDVGVRLPAGNDVEPFRSFADQTLAWRSEILYRMPFGAGVKDTVELLQLGGPGYVKNVLPTADGVPSGLNLVTQPLAFDNAAWTKNRASITTTDSTATLAPSGRNEAEVVSETTATGPHSLTQTNSTTDATKVYRWVAHLKKGTRSQAQILMTSGVDAGSSLVASVDLDTGVVTAVTRNGKATYLGSSSEALGNGWFRVSLIGRATTTPGTGVTGEIDLLNAINGSSSYAGDAGKNLFVWGAELSAYVQGNLVTQPSAFNDATWIKNRTSITADNTTAPDSTNTADFIKETLNQNGVHGVYQNLTTNVVSTEAFRWSVYLKKGTRSQALLMLDAQADTAGNAQVRVDLNTGTILSTSAAGSGTHLTSSIQGVGNDWYRVTLIGKATTGPSNQVYGEIYLLNNGSLGWNGDGASGLYAWGAELTTYFPENLVKGPNGFASTPWTLARTSATFNPSPAPDGSTSTTTFLAETSATGEHVVEQLIPASPTRSYTWSLVMKAAGRTQGKLVLGDATDNFNATVDLSAGTITPGAMGTGQNFGSTIQPRGNGWYRVTISGRPRAGTGTQVRAAANILNASGQASYAGSSTVGLYLWNAEVLATAN